MTRRAFLAGHPVKHSRSPIIHGYWLRQHGIDGFYEVVDVLPADLPAFLKTFGNRGFVGGNVTIPHKEAAFQTVDDVTERARRIGAVNTVFLDEGRLIGDNTDAVGFLSHLDQSFGPRWPDIVRTALVLGAGGAARAIAAGLADRGLERVWIANRTLARATDLARDLASAAIQAAAWTDIEDLLPRTDLLVNATSLGMTGQAPLELAVDRLKAGAIVSDAVYVPLETPLLAAARLRGHPIADGLGMLLHQAVPGFAYWFGVTPHVDESLRALVVADLPS